METKKYTGIRVGQADGTTYVEALAFCQAIGYQGASGIADQMPSKRLEQLDGAGRKRTMISLEDALVLATKKGRSEVWLALQAAIVAGEEDAQVAKPADLTVATTEAAPRQSLSAGEPPKPRILGSDIFGLRGDIRIVDHNGNDWYVANEVAKALDYTNPHKAILDHCKGANETLVPSNGGMQLTKIISAGDVFALVNNSQLPGVQPFKDWINHKVLVSIDKTGEYKLPEPVKEVAVVPSAAVSQIAKTDSVLMLCKQIFAELETVHAARNKAVAELTYTNEKLVAVESKLEEAEVRLDEAADDVAFAEMVRAGDKEVLVRTFAGYLANAGFITNEIDLYSWLRHYGYIDASKTSNYNLPRLGAIRNGYLCIRTGVIDNGSRHDGEKRPTAYITQRGLHHLYSRILAVCGKPKPGEQIIMDRFDEATRLPVRKKYHNLAVEVGGLSVIPAPEQLAKAAAKLPPKQTQTEFIICQ